MLSERGGKALALRRSSDRALMIVCGCNLFELGTFLRRLDNFLADLLLSPAQVEALLDALMERHLAMLEKVCAAVGDVADILRFGDDLGTDGGPFMAPVTYRRLFKPRHAQLCDYVHRHSRMKTLLHSCGSVYRLMPDLIEAGYDVINPVQTSSRDMEPERLKREFGQDICFWGGGCDTRRVLNWGTPAEVRDHVRRRISRLSQVPGNLNHRGGPDVGGQSRQIVHEQVVLLAIDEQLVRPRADAVGHEDDPPALAPGESNQPLQFLRCPGVAREVAQGGVPQNIRPDNGVAQRPSDRCTGGTGSTGSTGGSGGAGRAGGTR